MCNAKLLCGLAALVLVMGGLLLRTHAVAAQRERAEAERRQSEEALRALKEQGAKAEQMARQGIAEAERLLRQGADNVRQELGPNLEKALDQLAELRVAAREKFNAERQELMERMKKLEAIERETLAKIEAKANELKNRPAGQVAPASEKLDRILERLDRIEQRLERLERSGPSSGGKK